LEHIVVASMEEPILAAQMEAPVGVEGGWGGVPWPPRIFNMEIWRRLWRRRGCVGGDGGGGGRGVAVAEMR
jgi:hypothetical protein